MNEEEEKVLKKIDGLKRHEAKMVLYAFLATVIAIIVVLNL